MGLSSLIRIGAPFEGEVWRQFLRTSQSGHYPRATVAGDNVTSRPSSLPRR